MKKQIIKKALFLDRDGVINKDLGYISKIADFKFINEVFEALRGFLSLGYEIFVVTNQSGIGRAYYTMDDFYKINEFMLNELKKEHIHIKKVYFCPHVPEDNCKCRKPKPGMILQACEDFNINPNNCILIGDKQSDVQAGYNAGIKRCFLIGEKYKSLKDVYDKIIKKEKYERD